MARIPLRNKQKETVAYAIVSPEDEERVKSFSWHGIKGNKYAAGWVKIDGTRMKYLMHHFIMGKPPKRGLMIDHKNGNGLDNNRENLRIVDASENAQNSNRRRKYDYVGVRYEKKQDRWSSKCHGHSLGVYDDAKSAAIAYDRYAFAVFGKDAKTNGLTTYEECKHLKKEDLISKKKIGVLPRNIYLKYNKYYCRIQYKTRKFVSCYLKTQAEAEEQLVKYKEEIEAIKEKELQLHLSRHITKEEGKAYLQVGQERTLVDECLWHRLNSMWWTINNHGYVTGSFDGSTVQLHLYVMKLNNIKFSFKDGDLIDHINQNRLDNRFCNLRVNSDSGNAHNKKKLEGTTSTFKGVHFFPRDNNWMAQINCNHKYHYIGYFDTEAEAAIAYNIKAKALYGDFANLNIVEGENEIIASVQNKLNSVKKKKGVSKYRGVYYQKPSNKWVTSIHKNKVKYSVGSFETEEAAARAYNQKAMELYGKDYKFFNKF